MVKQVACYIFREIAQTSASVPHLMIWVHNMRVNVAVIASVASFHLVTPGTFLSTLPMQLAFYLSHYIVLFFLFLFFHLENSFLLKDGNRTLAKYKNNKVIHGRRKDHCYTQEVLISFSSVFALP